MIKHITRVIKEFIYAIVGYCIIIPLSFIIPKKKNLIIFIGGEDGRFLDNAKYLFLYLHNLKASGLEYYFLTRDKGTYKKLRLRSLPVLYYPRFRTSVLLLRADILIVDNWVWIEDNKYFYLLRTYKVQLWHGIGFKNIRLTERKYTQAMKNIFIKAYFYTVGYFPYYDLLISTSEFYTENVFKLSFVAGTFLNAGYPRNDVFFSRPKDTDIETDDCAMKEVERLKKAGCKVLLYAPTFRDAGGTPITDKALNVKRISSFCVSNNAVFVIKPHPYHRMSPIHPFYDNFVYYNRLKDVYPLLPYIDILITDYSSIYMDYLLLDRPIIFYPYDYAKYVKRDRELQFDYDRMTPGPKCLNQGELERELARYLASGEDPYREEREKLLTMAFKYRDGDASKRIWEYIKNNRINSVRRRRRFMI